MTDTFASAEAFKHYVGDRYGIALSTEEVSDVKVRMSAFKRRSFSDIVLVKAPTSSRQGRAPQIAKET